jgi:hypothetical protein
MTWVGFEFTIPGSDRPKTVHALDRSATVTGSLKKLALVTINKGSNTELLFITENKITVCWGVNNILTGNIEHNLGSSREKSRSSAPDNFFNLHK